MVTIISGTNRPNSSTYKLSLYYQKRLAEKGLDSTLFPLTELPPNLIETDMYGKRSPEF
jgi:chromate reductase